MWEELAEVDNDTHFVTADFRKFRHEVDGADTLKAQALTAKQAAGWLSKVGRPCRTRALRIVF